MFGVQSRTRDEKRAYKRAIKIREEKYYAETGKAMPKDEQKSEDIYIRYKQVRAKAKLVKALLSKNNY